MSDRLFEENRFRELQAILDNLRYECQDLIDEYYVAFRESGRARDSWTALSEFEHEWFTAMNREKLTFEERRGALKVVRAYLQSQIETLKLEAMYKKEGHRHAP